MANNSNRKSEGTPKWMKKLVRARMAQTGEKYTQALRAIKEERAASSSTDSTSLSTPSMPDVAGSDGESTSPQ